jgi:hypothetical protein
MPAANDNFFAYRPQIGQRNYDHQRDSGLGKASVIRFMTFKLWHSLKLVDIVHRASG